MVDQSGYLQQLARVASLHPAAWAALAAGAGALTAVGLVDRPALAVAGTLGAIAALALVAEPALLLVVLVASVFGEVLSVGGIAISRLTAPVALALLLTVGLRERGRISWRLPLTLAVAYALWALTSALWTVSVSGTLYMLASLAIGITFMLAFAVLIRTERDLRRVFGAIVVAALAIAVFAIVSFAFQVGDLVEGRAAGGAGDPNLFAAYQVVALPIVVAVAVHAKTPLRRTLAYGSAAIILASVFTSLSRGGLLTLAGVALLLLTLPASRVFSSGRQKFATIAVLAIASVAAFQVAGPRLTERVDSIFSSDRGGSGRLNEWRAAQTSISERPLTGLGYGGFEAVSIDLLRRTPGVDVVNYEIGPEPSKVHSAYIGTTAELGLPGLALFVALVLSTAHLLWSTSRRARALGAVYVARAASALFVGLGGFALASVFLSTETSRALWILIGISLALPRLLERGAAPAFSSSGRPANELE